VRAELGSFSRIGCSPPRKRIGFLGRGGGRFFEGNQNASGFVGTFERDMAAPRQRANGLIRIDPQSIAAQRHFHSASRFEGRSWSQAGKIRHEAGKLRVQVFQDNPHVLRQFRELLIIRRFIKKAAIEVDRERRRGELMQYELSGVSSESIPAGRPGWGNWAKPNRRNDGTWGDHHARGQKIREFDATIPVTHIEAHAHGIARVRSSARSFVHQRHA